MPSELFSTVLVANRGEIACRVIGTLQRLGIRSVAVYSDADRDAKHVRLADAAVRLGPSAPQESYLNIPAILAAARRSGAQAIHPGYGFLSESAGFARACEEAGVVFIGPGVGALEVMGDKIRAKTHVAEHDVPVIPGIAQPGLSDDDLIAAAEEIGYPVLVKPSAGGGGKGMQAVERAEDLPAALGAARRVAASAFGDDTLFLEKLVASPRHIEVQVLADAHGAIVHLGERECSLQRRHQKVIEEAPSPLLAVATRRRIGEAACAAAASVDYVGAGTIEFLVSAEAPDEFFFMEMNTRLQVEHPVTELITGLDLVEWQVRVAAGEHLGFEQRDLSLTGHAIEARVYAERPAEGFLPSSGTVLALHEAAGEGIRVDSSLLNGLTISQVYDPMLAKVIAVGDDRNEALARLDRALAETAILGVHTNVEYLRALLARPEVRSGDLSTTLIDRVMPQLALRTVDDELLAAGALTLHAERWSDDLWRRPDGWRLGTPAPARYLLGAGAEGAAGVNPVEVLVTGTPGRTTVEIAGRSHEARFLSHDGHAALFEFDGAARTLLLARSEVGVWVGEDGAAVELRAWTGADAVAARLAGRDQAAGAIAPEVRSPMPGTVAAVSVSAGERVAAGQALVVIEAMKMEHPLTAPFAGIVAISVQPGDVVKHGQAVATVTSAEWDSTDEGGTDE